MSQESSGSAIPSISDSLGWSFIEPIPEYPDYSEWGTPGIFDINIPIHPTYKQWLNPVLKIGDLVETYNGEMGIIIEMKEPEGIALRINDANNNSYKVLIGDQEKVYIGYSLKRVEKKS
jgi:hypothetical protein